MHFFRTALVALMATTASIKANPLHEYQQRSTDDLCANVNANLNIIGIEVPIDLCLCVSGVPDLIAGNAVLRLAVTLLGESAVTAAITALINAAPDHAQCHYPDHAVPKCDASDPCAFTCDDGYKPYSTSHPKKCVPDYN